MRFDLNDLINLVTDKIFESKRDSANEIVRNHVLWSMGAGILPIPLADVAAVTAIQLNMIRRLCEKYDVDYSESLGKSLITALVAGTAARIGASIIKGVPVFGPLLGSLPMSLMSGASTYAVGQVFISHFEANGTLENFDIDTWRRTYEEQLEKGRSFATQWRNGERVNNPDMGNTAGNTQNPNQNQPVPEKEVITMEMVIAKLEKLNDLKTKGIITEDEFLTQKQKLLHHL